MRSSAVVCAKNVFEVLSCLPNHGMGARLAKSGWRDGCYYLITRVKLSQDGAHGKAYGVLHWKEQQKNVEAVALPGPLKKRWRVVGGSRPTAVPSLAAAALRQEAAAAVAEGAASQEAAAATQQVAQ